MGYLKYSVIPGLHQVFRSFAVMSGNQDYKSAKTIYDFEATSIKGEVVPLSKYEGHVCLIVNVASKCGLTATNYKELNELYDKYAESQGLRILAFPCNQFNSQEPGTSEDICNFAQREKVKFDLFEKIDVNGDNAHPLWKYLKKEQGSILGDFIKWNFTKFIVDKNGKPVERHGPDKDPLKLAPHLEKYF
ncbi:probable phospholipid hydroperoxide glutathione peroxidase isoform X1 [Fopius arisanus]|uniref:Glutathione peroxidase n=2 Tax=Fopius arisanus TaxID=64838 RepID=A0A9R1TFL7_9HYME|nr:PREDICTED: probable phospholipid hydroperoxide glutathione peroxidase isoform X1 [Fopius arisanus]